MLKYMSYITLIVTLFFAVPAQAAGCAERRITRDMVLDAQSAWAEAIVRIGASDNPRQTAIEVLDSLYAYGYGQVFFKPTLAAEEPFRGTKEDALSYFVGGHIKEDKGFALTPFTNVRFENEGIIISCDAALASGHYFFTKTDGGVIKVEYSFGYILDDNGQLRINLQHSSLPFGTGCN